MSMIKEFKEFAMKGNVVELAVAVIIGSAFERIVNSLVEDILTPLLLQPALKAAGAANIETWAPGGVLLGKFIAAIISFIVIASILFLIVKLMNAAIRKKEEQPKDTEFSTSEKLLIEIRDSLKR